MVRAQPAAPGAHRHARRRRRPVGPMATVDRRGDCDTVTSACIAASGDSGDGAIFDTPPASREFTTAPNSRLGCRRTLLPPPSWGVQLLPADMDAPFVPLLRSPKPNTHGCASGYRGKQP